MSNNVSNNEFEFGEVKTVYKGDIPNNIPCEGMHQYIDQQGHPSLSYTVFGITIPIRIFRGIHLVNIEDIADVMRCDTANIRMMYSRRQNEFIEGEHYFTIKPKHLAPGGGGAPYVFKNKYNQEETVLDYIGSPTLNMEASNRGTLYFTKPGFLLLTVTMHGEVAVKVRQGLCNMYFEVEHLLQGRATAGEIEHIGQEYGHGAIEEMSLLRNVNSIVAQMRYVPLSNEDIDYIKLCINLRAKTELHYSLYSTVKIDDMAVYTDIRNYLWNMVTKEFKFIQSNFGKIIEAVRTFPISVTIARLVKKDENEVVDEE